MIARGLSEARGREGGIPQVATKERLSEAKNLSGGQKEGGMEGRREVWRKVGREEGRKGGRGRGRGEGGRRRGRGGREEGREGECLPGSLSNGEGLQAATWSKTSL